MEHGTPKGGATHTMAERAIAIRPSAWPKGQRRGRREGQRAASTVAPRCALDHELTRHPVSTPRDID